MLRQEVYLSIKKDKIHKKRNSMKNLKALKIKTMKTQMENLVDK